MKRRQFIHGLTALLALTVTPGPQARQFSTAMAKTNLLSFLGDHDYICGIGQSYRKRFPSENNSAILADAILSQTGSLDESDMRQYIDDLVKQDFERDDTLLLNGWMLSRTEARQTALYSMLYS